MTLILLHTLRGGRLTLVLLCLGLAGFAILIAVTFSTFAEVQENLFESLPENIKTLLKTQGGLLSTPSGYLATGYRHPVYLIILAAFVIGSSSAAMAREIERGTIFLLLARPVQRHRLVIAKLAAMSLGLVLLVRVSLLGSWVGVLVAGIDGVQFRYLLLVQLNALFLFMAIGGYSFLISALSSEGGRSTALAAGLAVVFFFADFLAALWSPVEFLGPLSIFYYYDPVSIVGRGGVLGLHLAVLGLVAIVGFAAAIVTFERRDVAG